MLERKAKEIVEEMNEVKSAMSKQFLGLIDIDCIDDDSIESLKLLTRCYRIMDSSMEYMVEQANTIDQLNEKLDKVIDLLNKRS